MVVGEGGRWCVWQGVVVVCVGWCVCGVGEDGGRKAGSWGRGKGTQQCLSACSILSLSRKNEQQCLNIHPNHPTCKQTSCTVPILSPPPQTHPCHQPHCPALPSPGSAVQCVCGSGAAGRWCVWWLQAGEWGREGREEKVAKGKRQVGRRCVQEEEQAVGEVGRGGEGHVPGWVAGITTTPTAEGNEVRRAPPQWWQNAKNAKERKSSASCQSVCVQCTGVAMPFMAGVKVRGRQARGLLGEVWDELEDYKD